jgi:hypothetical protein
MILGSARTSGDPCPCAAFTNASLTVDILANDYPACTCVCVYVQLELYCVCCCCVCPCSLFAKDSVCGDPRSVVLYFSPRGHRSLYSFLTLHKAVYYLSLNAVKALQGPSYTQGADCCSRF